jgi:hypothetical protein
VSTADDIEIKLEDELTDGPAAGRLEAEGRVMLIRLGFKRMRAKATMAILRRMLLAALCAAHSRCTEAGAH